MRRFGRRRAMGTAPVAAGAVTAWTLLFVSACGRSLYAPPACSDGVDNDHDGRTDLEDPQCIGSGDDDEGPAGTADAETEADIELDDSGREAETDAPTDVEADADGDADAPVDVGVDADGDVDAPLDVEADGDVREPCADGFACETMPVGRCVSGACASVWVSTEAGNQFGQAVALEGSRADTAPSLSPGSVLIGAPDAMTFRGHAALSEAVFWREVASWDGGGANERFGWAVAVGPNLGGGTGLALAIGTNTAAVPAAPGRVSCVRLRDRWQDRRSEAASPGVRT